MKALQEKKTRLPSLLRWGLVVFSLAALVLAGCNTGGDDDGGSVGIRQGKDILSMRVIKAPDNISYEGLPVDLRGIEVLIDYVDGSPSQIIKDHTLFYTMPDTNAIPGRMPYPAQPGQPGRKNRYPTNGDTLIGDNMWSMDIPEDYPFAEYGVLDYFLAYNPANRELITAPLRIKGVLDLEEIHFLKGLPEQVYYIDDMVDFTGVVVELKYNDRRGFFQTNNGRIAEWGDKLGTPQRVETPFDTRWDWSLNYPRSKGAQPFMRLEVGNRLVRNVDFTSDLDYRVGERYTRRDEKFKTLYMVDKMVVKQEPTTLPSNGFLSNYQTEYMELREEWLYKYLKDVEVTVYYKDQNGADAPETKKIVLDPAGEPMTLPMAEYFTGNFVPLITNLNGNDFRYGDFQGPPLNGRDTVIRGAEPGTSRYNPYHNYLVFTHQNVERRKYYGGENRYGRRNRIANPVLNTNIDFVKSVTCANPIEVYVLQPELTITPATVSFPVWPESARGNVTKFLDALTINAQWIYMDATGGNEKIRTDPIASDDPRLTITGNRTVTIDNINYGIGAGIYRLGFWMNTRNGGTITLRYDDVRGDAKTGVGGGTRATGEVELELTDPNEV